jgi:hypothetical protein
MVRNRGLLFCALLIAACSDDDGEKGKADGGDGTGGTGANSGSGGRGTGGVIGTGGSGGSGGGGATATGGSSTDGRASDASTGTGGRSTSTDAGSDASDPNTDAGVDGAPPDLPSAAAVITVVPGTGATCSAAHGELQFPRDQRVVDRLLCDLSTDCKPDDYKIVSGDHQTTVECTVSRTGDSYSVSASLSLQGDTINLTGAVSPIGGTVQLAHYSTATQITLQGDCTLTILSNRGLVAPGKLWAQFSCAALRDPHSASSDVCHTFGAILFENCTK